MQKHDRGIISQNIVNVIGLKDKFKTRGDKKNKKADVLITFL